MPDTDRENSPNPSSYRSDFRALTGHQLRQFGAPRQTLGVNDFSVQQVCQT